VYDHVENLNGVRKTVLFLESTGSLIENKRESLLFLEPYALVSDMKGWFVFEI
jgi:hypothetical protein